MGFRIMVQARKDEDTGAPKVAIEAEGVAWFDMYPDKAIQLGGELIRRAYEANGMPVPPTVILQMQQE